MKSRDFSCIRAKLPSYWILCHIQIISNVQLLLLLKAVMGLSISFLIPLRILAFITSIFSYGRKDINANEDYLKEECYETYNNHYKKRMEALKFTNEEITALAAIESFGIIDVSEKYYTEPRFTNTYYKNH